MQLLIQIIGQSFLERIQHVMLGRRVDALVAQCLLRFPNIPFGELRAHKPPDVMRLDSLNVFR